MRSVRLRAHLRYGDSPLHDQRKLGNQGKATYPVTAVGLLHDAERRLQRQALLSLEACDVLHLAAPVLPVVEPETMHFNMTD